MQHSKTTGKAQDLVLYHGTLGIEGGKISLRSNQGVGWNNLTLGDAFYTTPNLEASKLFSHLVLQKNILRGGERQEN